MHACCFRQVLRVDGRSDYCRRSAVLGRRCRPRSVPRLDPRRSLDHLHVLHAGGARRRLRAAQGPRAGCLLGQRAQERAQVDVRPVHGSRAVL